MQMAVITILKADLGAGDHIVVFLPAVATNALQILLSSASAVWLYLLIISYHSVIYYLTWSPSNDPVRSLNH